MIPIACRLNYCLMRAQNPGPCERCGAALGKIFERAQADFDQHKTAWRLGIHAADLSAILKGRADGCVKHLNEQLYAVIEEHARCYPAVPVEWVWVLALDDGPAEQVRGELEERWKHSSSAPPNWEQLLACLNGSKSGLSHYRGLRHNREKGMEQMAELLDHGTKEEIERFVTCVVTPDDLAAYALFCTGKYVGKEQGEQLVDLFECLCTLARRWEGRALRQFIAKL
jgi:hypothetical protein